MLAEFGLGVGTAVLQECIATIDAEHRAFGANTLGDLYRRIAESAAYVHGFDDDTLHRDCVRTISPQAPIVSIVSAAGIAVTGDKGAHVKAHLLGGVLIGYPHRAGPSSEATATQAVGATRPVDMVDTNGDVVAAS